MTNKILITGGGGFIGSHLVELLVERGYEVVAFDRYNPNNHWGWLENSKHRGHFEMVLGDIRDYDSVYRALANCDVVFHLAALISVPYSYVSPLAYIRTNVEGTYNVLEAAKNQSDKKVYITSTSETYGSAQYTPMDEGHPCVGQSPYAASKIAADQLALSYFLSFNLPIVTIRPFNTFGPRQSTRAVIPTIITQILEGKETITLGALSPKRDLTFVADICNAFIEIHRSNEFIGEATNIGMGSSVSISYLVKTIMELIGCSLNIEEDDQRLRPQTSEVLELLADNTQLTSRTNWQPRYDLKRGLSETIEWHKALENRQYSIGNNYAL